MFAFLFVQSQSYPFSFGEIGRANKFHRASQRGITAVHHALTNLEIGKMCQQTVFQYS